MGEGQCHMERVKAREMIEGNVEENYAKDYTSEVLRSNSRNTCKVWVIVNPNDMDYFQRFYICFKALKDAWNEGCIHVTGLDGCFLKGKIKRELLTTIGRHAYNHVFPIA
uniref:Uncharacterized protein n=1 Tax=Lactuca sativa TaxID=4236 RepID=A0A9R1V512_LACSA|nr:hypothetical protein LSAT_V11C600332310 [Lactuca sativa]